MPRQPGRSDNTTVFIFGIQADPDKLQALCDLTLNPRDANDDPLHPDLEYRVMTSVVMLMFMKMGNLCSLDPQDSTKGLLRENELNVAIPLLVFERIAGIMVPVRMVWYMPYLWIDSGVCMTMGRETYGFPKTMAHLVVPEALGDPALFTVDAEVWDPAHVSPPCQELRVVTVQRPNGGVVTAMTSLEIEEFALDAISAFQLPALAAPFATVAGWLAEARFVFLKQFRDHANGDDACYQAIVEAPVTYPAFHSLHWLEGPYQAELYEYASTPLVSDLGLAGMNGPGTMAVQNTLFAGMMNFDFVLGNGQTVWLAP